MSGQLPESVYEKKEEVKILVTEECIKMFDKFSEFKTARPNRTN